MSHDCAPFKKGLSGIFQKLQCYFLEILHNVPLTFFNMASASTARFTDEEPSPTFPLADSHLLKNEDENFLQAGLKPSQAANESSLGLGTLGRLPIELRHLIYQEITTTYRKFRFVENVCGFAFIELFKPFECCRLFETLSKLARAQQIVSALRASSKTIEFEYDEWFLSTTSIMLDQPCQLICNLLAKGLSPLQTSWIRRISITIDTYHTAEQWPSFLRQYAPPNLRAVVIDFAHDHGHNRARKYLDMLPKISAEIAYAAGLFSSNRCDIPGCKHLGRSSAIANIFEIQLHGFESVVKFLKASQPEARIEMAPTNCRRCPGLCAAILEGIRTDEN